MKKSLLLILLLVLCELVDANFNQVLRKARSGEAVSQYYVGWYYLQGEGVQRDYTQAANWFRESANQGVAEAQYMLGDMYEEGLGVSQDYMQAVYWYRKAAQLGNADAQNSLGRCYVWGNGISQDYTQALYWFRIAAGKGNIAAQSNLGYMYDMGLGVEQNFDQAKYYYQMAANRGNVDAEYALSRVLAEQGNYVIAHQVIDGLIKRYPTEPYYYDRKGELFAMQNDYKNALIMWKKVLQMDKTFAGNNTALCKYINGGSQQTTVAGVADEPAVAFLSDEKSDVDSNIPMSNILNTKTFAVIIGNENYKKVANVDFAINDANTFANYCRNTLGIPQKQIRKYTDVTYGDMLGAIRDIKDIAQAYKGQIRVIFYYAGHGVPDESSKDAYLLPIDADGTVSEVCMPVSRLYAELASMETNSVVAFMDACFSGSQRGEGMLASARGVAIKSNPVKPQGNMVIFTAAQGDETAYPDRTEQHGLFTYYLLKKLQESRGDVTLSDLSEFITTNVSQQSIVLNHKPQTPCVKASSALGTNWHNWKLR